MLCKGAVHGFRSTSEGKSPWGNLTQVWTEPVGTPTCTNALAILPGIVSVAYALSRATQGRSEAVMGSAVACTAVGMVGKELHILTNDCKRASMTHLERSSVMQSA